MINLKKGKGGFASIIQKHQSEGGYGDYLEEKLRITGIVIIYIEEMIGKEDLGKEKHKETLLKALEGKIQLPIVLEHE